MSTDRTIGAKLAHELRAGNVIVRIPDPEQVSESGRWLVTNPPRMYSPYVRIDTRDEDARRDVVWIIPERTTVVVEVSGQELQLRAAQILTTFMSEDLPAIHSWDIGDKGLNGMLSSGALDDDQARAELDRWRARLGAEELIEEHDGRRTKLTASAVLDGVPVTVWTSVWADEPPATDTADEGQAAAADEQNGEAAA